MAWLAVDNDGEERMFDRKPTYKDEHGWWQMPEGRGISIDLSKDSIEKLINKKLTCEDEPVEI